MDGKIKFSWQSRVKEAGSLREKLEERRHNHQNDTNNINDIKDLVAGPVILTRWKDFSLVEKAIEENFQVENRSQHPKSGCLNRLSGLTIELNTRRCICGRTAYIYRHRRYPQDSLFKRFESLAWVILPPLTRRARLSGSAWASLGRFFCFVALCCQAQAVSASHRTIAFTVEKMQCKGLWLLDWEQ